MALEHWCETRLPYSPRGVAATRGGLPLCTRVQTEDERASDGAIQHMGVPEALWVRGQPVHPSQGRDFVPTLAIRCLQCRPRPCPKIILVCTRGGSAQGLCTNSPRDSPCRKNVSGTNGRDGVVGTPPATTHQRLLRDRSMPKGRPEVDHGPRAAGTRPNSASRLRSAASRHTCDGNRRPHAAGRRRGRCEKPACRAPTTALLLSPVEGGSRGGLPAQVAPGIRRGHNGHSNPPSPRLSERSDVATRGPLLFATLDAVWQCVP